MAAGATRLQGHFLAGEGGPLAVVTREPAGTPAFAVLYLPPFGDEMNKARRMVSLQAQALAAAGGAVAVLDPRGTGDSGGDHGDATWEGWRADAALAFAWLARRTGRIPLVWGLRLGGTLAVDAMTQRAIAPSAVLLWQPVTRGKVYANQVLRLATVQQQVDGAHGRGAGALREALRAGRPVEIAGYALHPRLFQAIEDRDLQAVAPPGIPVVWREVASTAQESPSPAVDAVVGGWRAARTEIDVATVTGPPFWMTQEIEVAPSLVTSTTDAVRHLSGVHASH
ncbi:MAG: hydrolase 2, exosortase A system-associated [Burkholderiales bacterium]